MNEHVGEQLGLMVSLAFGRLGISNSGINSPHLSSAKTPCLKMHFNCIKVVSRLPMGRPCPILPFPSPPTRWLVISRKSCRLATSVVMETAASQGRGGGCDGSKWGHGAWNFPGTAVRRCVRCVRAYSNPPLDSKMGGPCGGILRRGV